MTEEASEKKFTVEERLLKVAEFAKDAVDRYRKEKPGDWREPLSEALIHAQEALMDEMDGKPEPRWKEGDVVPDPLHGGKTSKVIERAYNRHGWRYHLEHAKTYVNPRTGEERHAPQRAWHGEEDIAYFTDQTT